MNKKYKSKPVNSVSVLRFSIFKDGKASDPKHVEKIKSAKTPTNISNRLLD